MPSRRARFDPAMGDEDRLDDVLVIFVAKQKIIGWYGASIVHGAGVRFPSTVAIQIRKRLKGAGTKNFKIERYRLEWLPPDLYAIPNLLAVAERPEGRMLPKYVMRMGFRQVFMADWLERFFRIGPENRTGAMLVP
jgi:hypothetical protein